MSLQGTKILDFSRLLPGPLGTHILSQMGAEIIKNESPKRMDYCRFCQPQINGVSTLFHTLNDCKKQIVVDYETPEGYQGALELKFWNLFCDMVDRPLWKTAENTNLIIGVFDIQKLEDLFKTETRDEWVNKSINFDVCLTPVFEVNEVYGQKQTKERGMFKDVEIDDITIKIYAKPYKSYSFS